MTIPQDDGAADHLVRQSMPDLSLQSTSSDSVNLANITGWAVVFCYPKTGQPGVTMPDEYTAIPGVVGCTPQACAYRDQHDRFADFNAQLFAVSTQSHEYQMEMATRLNLPYPVLSDGDLALCRALNLPTIEFEGEVLMKRMTMLLHDGVVQSVHYPVHPPDADAGWAIAQLRLRAE